ncbi:MAG: PH domain-containing protein [Lachnospiraceae bacterium]|nr:PH domain-containing protein [Lachnospiraceae bacterium]MBR1854988.1 PH domain-containing protein [Lachnospiraceae bacterium]
MMEMSQDMRSMIGGNETVLWTGKPDKKCFILEGIFNPLLPFAMIWFFVDAGIAGGALFASRSEGKQMLFFLIPFLLIHMMPVWIYLGGCLFVFRKYRNTEYAITDRAIYTTGGLFTKNFEMKPFAELSHVAIHRGIFDQWLGVGDVNTVCEHTSHNHNGNKTGHGMNLCDLKDYNYVFNMVKQLQQDIYTDAMFPNAMRPEQNPGYNTQYTGGKQFR